MAIKKQLISIIFIAIVSILCGLISYFTPYQNDDLSYLLYYHDYKEGLTDTFDYAHIINFAANHWLNVNGRMANLCTPITLALFPKWLFSTLTAIMIYPTIFSSLKLVRASSSNTNLTIAFCFAYIVMLPWYDFIYLSDFTLNYIWAGAFVLTFLVLFFTTKTANKTNQFLPLVFAFFAGTWHEGYDLPICAGLTIYIILNWKTISQHQLFLFGAFFLGTMLPLTSPGIWCRYDTESSVRTEISLIEMPLFSLIACSTLLFILSIKKNDRNKILYALFFNIAALAGLFFYFKTYTGTRVIWFSCTYALIGIFYILNQLSAIKKLAILCLTTILTLFVIVHLIVTLKTQIELNNDNDNIIELYRTSEDGCVFYDYTFEKDRPLMSLFRCKLRYEGDWHAGTFSEYYGSKDKYLRVIPTKLRHTNYKTHRLVSMNPAIYDIDGLFVTEYSDTTSRLVQNENTFIELEFENGNKYTAICYPKQFKNVNGSDLIFLHLQRQLFLNNVAIEKATLK